MYTSGTLGSQRRRPLSLLIAILLVVAYTTAGDSLEVSQVQVLDTKHIIEPGMSNTVRVWVTGRVKHTLPVPIVVQLETRVYNSAGGFLGSHAFLIHDPIPPHGYRGFRNEALGYDLPADTSIGTVTIQVLRVSQPWH